MNFRKKDLTLHSLMCIIGGFLGCYAILCRSKNLGSAQTSNMIEIVCCLLGDNIGDFLLRVFGCILYITALLICVYLSKKTPCNMEKYAIIIDILGLVILSFLPMNINPVIGILPIFFMAATQWSVFHGLGSYNSSTIFSTNNLRQCVTAVGEYCIDKNKKQLDKAKFYGNSLLWYHVGVVGAFFGCRTFAVYASLFCIPVAILAFGVTCYDNIHFFTGKRTSTAATAD